MKKALFNWSGGKDSSLALYHVLEDDRYEISGLFTSFNEANDRVSMHGIHQSLVNEQARQIGISLQSLMLPEDVDMEEYNHLVQQSLKKQKEEGVETCIFGDILLEDLKDYRQQQLQKVELEADFPLWGQSTERLSRQFIDLGFKAIIVSVSENKMAKSFVGRAYDASFLADLPEEVDPCGENGEFHTFVYDGPIFTNPIAFNKGDIVSKTYELEEESQHYFFQEIIPSK